MAMAIDTKEGSGRIVVEGNPFAHLVATPEERARILAAGRPFDVEGWLRNAVPATPEEVAELRLGAEIRNWGLSRRARMDQFIHASLIHYPDDALCTFWASLVAEQRRRGQPIEQHDAWVATTALYLGIPLVTHNAGHYLGV